MGWIPRWGSLWMAFLLVSAPHFVSLFVPLSIFLPLLRRTKASTLWSFFFLTFIGSMNWILVILNFWASIHLLVNAYHACSFGTGFPHLRWYFQVPSICLQILWSNCFNSWVVFHYVNVPHFLYLLLCWRTSGFFPASGYYKQGCYEYNGACVLVICWNTIWV